MLRQSLRHLLSRLFVLDLYTGPAEPSELCRLRQSRECGHKPTAGKGCLEGTVHSFDGQGKPVGHDDQVALGVLDRAHGGVEVIYGVYGCGQGIVDAWTHAI